MISLRAGLGRIAFVVIASGASAQTTTDLVGAARQVASTNPDSAQKLLQVALEHASQRTDSATVVVWRGILLFFSEGDSVTRAAFHEALRLNPDLNVRGLEQVSPRLAELFAQEKNLTRPAVTLTTNDVTVQPARIGGPPVAYPPDVWRRGVRGNATVEAVVDTSGRIDPASLQIIQIPDSQLSAPLRRAMLAWTFTPGQLQGRPVRTMLRLRVELTPGPPPNPTQLVGEARALVAAHHADSALDLLAFALDTLVGASPGEKVYARLVLGMALTETGRDSLANAAYDSALAGYRDLTARHVDLAPFLRRLADSIRVARRAGRLAVATTLGELPMSRVDQRPQLLSQPTIRYPPEMLLMKMSGRVLVEATVDETGHVVAGSVKVLQSTNHLFDAEAQRVVRESLYRPARIDGRAVSSIIRQPVYFMTY